MSANYSLEIANAIHYYMDRYDWEALDNYTFERKKGIFTIEFF